jgi:hypothetical protein
LKPALLIAATLLAGRAVWLVAIRQRHRRVRPPSQAAIAGETAWGEEMPMEWA